MNKDNYSLEEMCDTYIRLIHSGCDGYIRIDLHNLIVEKSKVGEEKITNILHNLDKVIGYNPNINYDITDFPKMGKKLAIKILESDRT